MPKAAISLNLGKLTASIDAAKAKLPAYQKRVVNATAKTMFAFVSDTIAEAQKNCAVRSGDLAASAIVADPVIGETAVTCEGGFNSPYAAQRNFGGTITAKPGKALAIPLDPALTARGVPKYSSPRELGGDARIVKLWGRAFIAKTAGKGKNRILTLFFVLKDHVDQKGDNFFSNAVEIRRTRAAGEIAEGVAGQLGGRL